MGELMKKLTVCVGVLCHSTVNNDELKYTKVLQEEFICIYELVRRNDTRWW